MKTAAILLTLFALIFLLSGCTSGSDGEYNQFSKCLTEKGVKMYGTEWCPHCKNQKELFGDSFKYVDYTDCDWNKEACQKAGVEGYPTWTYKGEKYAGVQSLEKLSEISDCNLEGKA